MAIEDNKMVLDYGNERFDKSKELNESMSIAPSEADAYTKKLESMGGN